MVEPENLNLPIRKINDQQSAPVMTTTGLIDKWIEEELYKPDCDNLKFSHFKGL
jgi:hypothetical protein